MVKNLRTILEENSFDEGSGKLKRNEKDKIYFIFMILKIFSKIQAQTERIGIYTLHLQIMILV